MRERSSGHTPVRREETAVAAGAGSSSNCSCDPGVDRGTGTEYSASAYAADQQLQNNIPEGHTHTSYSPWPPESHPPPPTTEEAALPSPEEGGPLTYICIGADGTYRT